ncbi:MAG: sterol desaturase family protein [Burkholderiales bacterium]|nr:sterol desaturase family protein [Burkholderiales bacterium]
MTSAQVIVLATPVFLGLIAFEFVVGLARGRNTYRLADALSSIGLGVMSQVVGLFTRLFAVGLYTLAYEHVALWQLSAGSVWVWLAALVGYDFCYYWLHRAGHRVAVLWAAHVVHHQSEDYNLSTALRQTSSGFLLGWMFYLPLAVLGVPPLVFGIVALIDLLYQFWVHTQQVDRLGWFDRWFCAPSNHRVHHAVNDRYLDKNYGGILLVWDRLFGSYAPEDEREPCVYGTRAPLRSWNPLWANLQVYRDLALDSWRTKAWPDKLRVWLAPPGWRPADVAAKWPRPAFDLKRFQRSGRYGPPITELAAWVAGTLFAVALLLTTIVLWNAHRLSPWLVAGLALLIVTLLWAVGRVTEPAADVSHDEEVSPETAPGTALASALDSARDSARASARDSPHKTVRVR